MKKENVPIYWYCKILKRNIKVSENAIYLKNCGWLCDCGNWITGKDENHKITGTAEREIYDD